MGKIKAEVFFLLIFWSQVAIGQDDQIQIDPAIALKNFVSAQPFEKTYLHTDKDYYFTDETVWLKLYLLDGSSHLDSKKSQLVYVELLNDKDSLMVEKKLYVENLSANGHIDLNSVFSPGTYRLRVYTSFMLNERIPVPFEKQITILGPEHNFDTTSKQSNEEINYTQTVSFQSDFEVRFFPEGGNMVNGIETSVAIQVTDKNGKGVSANGKIVDSKNQIVSFFTSREFGLGLFKILPLANEKYFAVFGDSEKYQLPEALSQGYVLNAKNKDSLILIDVATNIPKGLEGTYILGHLRGQIIYKQDVLAKRGADSYRIRFLTDKVPNGVAQFTLFRADGEPVCERLVFIDRSENDLKLTIDTDRSVYGPREPASSKLELTDAQGNPIDGKISLSVISADRLNLGAQKHSIESWLVLNSEIGGSIANPTFFFEDSSFGRSYLLDVLMMANSWRSFDWKETLRTQNFQELEYKPEKGIIINGRTVDFKTKLQPKEATVTLNLIGLTDGPYSEEQLTDSQGKFSFGPYVFQDTLKAVISAESLEKRRNGKSKNLSILLQDTLYFKKEIPKNVRKNTFVLQDENDLRAGQFATTNKSNGFQTDGRIIELDEAVVTEKKITRQDSINTAFRKLNPLYRSPSHRLFMDSIPGVTGLQVFDLFRRLPGARIKGAFPAQTLLLRQDFLDNPVFVVDGVITSVEMVQLMNTAEIEFIDVLKPSSAGFYGNMAGNGVVVIYTKGSLNLPQKNKSFDVPNINGFEVIGMSRVENFKAPDYSNPTPDHSQSDNRSTLHWQPDIEINNTEKQNTSEISFFTSDLSGPYIIKAEGITKDGRPISAMKMIEVKSK